MSKLAKLLLSLTALVAITGATSLWQRIEARRPESVICTVDIVHTTQSQNGTVIGTEAYQQEFVLTEGVDFVDDYSTFTRQKEFRASLEVVGGQATVFANWFADVSVFNSADFSTALVLVKGQKDGETSASHTFSSTPGHSTTTYTLTGIRR